MGLRIGKVSQVFPEEGMVKVVYEDEENASLKLNVLTFNNEYLMPPVGERVLTAHLENGSSKGFVLGTYYGSLDPKATSGYRKDFSNNDLDVAFETYLDSVFTLSAANIEFKCNYTSTSVESIIKRIEALEEAISNM